MKRKLSFILIVLLLVTGCSVERSEFSSHISKVIDESLERAVVDHQNNHKKLYSYYLPISMGKSESNSISTILEMSGYEIIMNLNVENVLSERYYGHSVVSIEALLNSELIYSTNGKYQDFEGEDRTYYLYVNELENGTSFIVLKTNHFTYLTNVNYLDIASVLQQLFTVARSTRINEDEIVSAYSRREVLNYENKIVEIFQEKAPVEGDLSTFLQSSNQEYDWNVDEMDYFEQNSVKGSSGEGQEVDEDGNPIELPSDDTNWNEEE